MSAAWKGAHSTEMVADTPHPIVALITEWMNPDGSTEQRDENSDLGGTMRLGAQPCHLSRGQPRAGNLRCPGDYRAPSTSLRGQQQLRRQPREHGMVDRRLVRGQAPSWR
jgi:hypothetical protein